MNPLFTAHLIGDFLLQPTWLVGLKTKKLIGVVFHSIVHLVVMGVLLMPRSPQVFALILGIALLHGLIDSIKIRYQKKQRHDGFVMGFMLDQAAHLGVILVSIHFFPSFPALWKSEAGKGILFLLAFYSFSMAWRNLLRLKQIGQSGTALLFLLIAVTFLMFMLPAVLIAA